MDTTTGLTRDNLKALRNANALVIRTHFKGSPHAPEGKDLPASWIECIKEHDPDDGFGRRELPRVEVPIELGRVENYTKGFGPVLYYSWVFQFTGWDHPIGTIVRGLLRVGDRVQPLILAGNDSDNIRNANMTQDEMHLIVERGPVDDPKKCKRYRFMLDSYFYPPHGLARQIRFGPAPIRTEESA